MKNLLILATTIVILFACKKEKIEPIAVEIPQPEETSAVYTLTFEGNWNLANQPTDYTTRAHFSRLIGMVHNNRTELIRLDRIASAGIKVMAETGNVSPLNIEIGNIVSNGDAKSVIEADKGLATGVASWSTEITVDKDFHYLSVVSMLAPSPDWFVGAASVNLYENEVFVDELNLDMIVYDGGTDSGESFTSPDSVTSPAVNPFVLVVSPVGNGSTVPNPFAKLTLKKNS